MSVDMRKQSAVNMIKKVEQQYGRLFDKANVQLAIDISGSMSGYYADERKPVTQLAEQTVGLALARLDPDGRVPLWAFGTRCYGPIEATAENLYPANRGMFKGRWPGVVEHVISKYPMGSTNMAAAIQSMTDHHIEGGDANEIPGLCLLQTDGAPDNEYTVKQELIRASRYNLFFVFLAYGQTNMFLTSLDAGIRGQTVDNVSTFIMGYNPLTVSDDELYEEILKEIPSWRSKAAGKVIGTV